MKTKTVVIIAAGLMAVALAAFLVVQADGLFAQEPGGGQGGQGGPGGGQGGGMGRGGDRMPRGGGGGAAMTVMGKYVFIATGRSLIKVDGEAMTIVKTLELPSSRSEDRPREGEKGE